MVHDLSHGSVQRGTIRRLSDGSFSVSLTVLEVTDTLTETCEAHAADSCVTAVTIPRREMTSDEMTRVLTLFSGVAVSQEVDAATVCALYDPYFVAGFAWDSLTTWDSPCSTPRIVHARADAIYQMLESLRLGS